MSEKGNTGLREGDRMVDVGSWQFMVEEKWQCMVHGRKWQCMVGGGKWQCMVGGGAWRCMAEGGKWQKAIEEGNGTV